MRSKTKKVDTDFWLSKCCNFEVSLDISADFIGDDPKKMTIGTCNFRCMKCKKPCDVKINPRLKCSN